MNSIIDVLEQWVNIKPDEILFSFLDESGEIKNTHTYHSFNEKTNNLANYLHTNYNFEFQDRVVLIYPPGLEFIESFIALTRLGVISIPSYKIEVNDLANEKFLKILENSSPKFIITTSQIKELLVDFFKKYEKENKLNYNITIPICIATDVNLEKTNSKFNFFSKILFIQYTSGSTGNPKGVVVTHDNIIANSNSTVDHTPIAVSWLPHYHDMGLIGYHLFIMINGGKCYMLSPNSFIRDPLLWIKCLSKYKATTSSAPNFAFDLCIKSAQQNASCLKNINLSTLTNLMIAADIVKSKTIRDFGEVFSKYKLNLASIYSAYGLAENTLTVTNYGRKILKLSSALFNLNKIKILEEDSVENSIELISCGKPIKNQIVKIVNSNDRSLCQDCEIGEVWISGPSMCSGYWNDECLTEKVFQNKLSNDEHSYLATGDLGFMYNDELYVCGRLKDLIIIRGRNLFPSDIENIVEKYLPQKSKTVAFGINMFSQKGEELHILIGLKNLNAEIDINLIHEEIIKYFGVSPSKIIIIKSNSIKTTTSGKIQRNKMRSLFIENKLPVNKIFCFQDQKEIDDNSDMSDWMRQMESYLNDEKDKSVGSVLDSLDLVIFTNEIKNYLDKKGVFLSDIKIDPSKIQELTISEIVNLYYYIEDNSKLNVDYINSIILNGEKFRIEEESIMLKEDANYNFNHIFKSQDYIDYESNNLNVLLTGTTGFFGPFLLDNLINKTNHTIYLFVRANSIEEANFKITDGLNKAGHSISIISNPRIKLILGDLEKNQLGLSDEDWNKYAAIIDIIYHNGAYVNYIYNYKTLRNANVFGTREIVKLCSIGKIKELNYISTTFIFGWAVKDTLYENEINSDTSLLDFGYSQTKWVAEKLVANAISNGLRARIFRPALISPGLNGDGYNFDISIRLISFMINNKIGVETPNQISFTPADIAAQNIVLISNSNLTKNKTYNITRDTYCNMKEITEIIGLKLGIEFTYLPLKPFVEEVINKCTQNEILYPLVSFLSNSVDKISSMKYKRYDNGNYKLGKSIISGIEDPSLEDVVEGILSFMKKHELINQFKK